MFVYDSGGLTGCRQAHTVYSVALSYPLYFVCMHGWWRASLVLHSRVNVFRLMDGVWYSAAGIVVMFESCVWGPGLCSVAMRERKIVRPSSLFLFHGDVLQN